jgi:glutamyl-tRNA synthetase/glutamyl-Q tRNA(Asp) synthetase
MPPTTRFAPSPTGYLHLGHVVNAIYVWGLAATLGGRVLLRIEDHDRIRSRDVFERAILDDLGWLGFFPDEGLRPVRRQSDNTAAYAAALERLQATDRVYACSCSRKDIVRLRAGAGAGASAGQEGEHRGERYPGTCRQQRLLPGSSIPDGVGIRVELDERPETFDDLALGRIVQVPAEQCGDLLLRDRDGHWTYQFAVTVDDMNDEVDLVVRGLDLLSSTGRQIKLARMLGRATPPVFYHHPLILKHDGEKLSKATGDTGIRDLRAAGAQPAAVIGRAAASAGLIDMPCPMDAAALHGLIRAHLRGRINAPRKELRENPC